ncbi:MAG: hypothetical protein V3T08_07590 [Gemmatimonadota bacterium]
MEPETLGPQGFTDEDLNYEGGRFSEVRDAVFANAYQKVWGGEDQPLLPVYKVTLCSVLTGLLPFGKSYQFLAAAKRAVDSHADLRWGPDRKGFRRLLHPNGVCLTGRWEITAETPYSGYFKKGSKGLVIGRYSTCCTETRRGHNRSLSLVGKIYPTLDPDHAELLCPASFITQQDLGGERTDYINDAELRNAPDTRAWRRGLGVPILLTTGAVFLRADKEPAVRQLYEIAELGKSKDEPTPCPEFMRLLVAPDQPRVEGEALDFRDELLAQIFDKGDPLPRRSLTFHIEVSDEGTKRGIPVFQRRTIKNWRHIGKITFDNGVASYNGDFVIHFHHPSWRDNRNDPSTATRVNRRKVRAKYRRG